MNWSSSKSLVIGGLIYATLAILIYLLTRTEPLPQLIFNLALSVTAISIGLIRHIRNYRRQQR